MIRHQLAYGEIVHARVENVYPTIAPGSVTLCHVDGPYGMGKAAWDKVKDLAAWYRPHIAEWGRVCAPSASVYLWNTAEGWAAIHPEMVAAGWTFRALVTWDKGIGFLAGKIDTEGTRTWPDVTEVCGLYQRDADSPFPDLLERRRSVAGLTRRDLATLFPSRTGGLTGCVLNWEAGYNIPTREQWVAMMERIMEAGTVTMPVWAGREYDQLRAQYESERTPFSLPSGVTNVWSHPLVGGAERLVGADGATLHPCQKPLLFARRIVEASSRPGDLVFEPFGGTCRIATACEAIGRYEPEKARRYVCVEMDEDGRGYIPAVLASLRGELRNTMTGQIRMFGG